MDDRFRSRKFILTVGVLVSTVVLALNGNMDANVALVFGACITAYNWANTKEKDDK